MRIGVISKLTTGAQRGGHPSFLNSHLQVIARTGITPTLFFPLNEASGDAIDTVSSATLVASGTNQYRYSGGGATGVYYGTTGGHSADIGDVGTGSVLVCSICTHEAGSGLPTVFGRTGASTGYPAYVLYRGSTAVTYPVFLVRALPASTVQLSLAAVDVVTARIPALYVGLVDRSTGLATLLVATPQKILGVTTGSIAGFGTFTGGVSPKLHFGKAGVFGAGAVSSCGFMATGAQIEGLDVTAFAKKLGFGGI